MLIILSGLPGAGKTAIGRELARRLGAVHLRIDSIEQAIREAGLAGRSMDDAGYRVAYAVAGDNLRLGGVVVADSVNPIAMTRDAWRDVAARAQARAIEMEIVCSDRDEHRRRIETRENDIPGAPSLAWADVVAREYRAWDRERIVIDTAGRTVDRSAAEAYDAIRTRHG